MWSDIIWRMEGDPIQRGVAVLADIESAAKRAIFLTVLWQINVSNKTLSTIQGSAKEWSLGCVIPASWSPLAAGAHFTQTRDHSLADPCMYRA